MRIIRNTPHVSRNVRACILGKIGKQPTKKLGVGLLRLLFKRQQPARSSIVARGTLVRQRKNTSSMHRRIPRDSTGSPPTFCNQGSIRRLFGQHTCVFCRRTANCCSVRNEFLLLLHLGRASIARPGDVWNVERQAGGIPTGVLFLVLLYMLQVIWEEERQKHSETARFPQGTRSTFKIVALMF